MIEMVTRNKKNEVEDATIKKLPKTFRIFLALEKEVEKGKGTPLQSDTTPETAEVPPDG